MGEEFNRANSRLSVARTELQRLDAGARTLGWRVASRTRSSSPRRSRLALQQEQALAEARAALEELRQDVGRLSEEHSALRVEMAGLEERRRAEQSASQRLENQMREVAHRRQQLTQELERLGVEKARLLSDNIELDSRAGDAHQADRCTGTPSRTNWPRRKRKAAPNSQQPTNRCGSRARNMQAASDRRSQIELNLVKKQAELKYLEETCNKQLGCTLQEVAEGDETVLDEVGLAEVEQKCQDLTSKIDALGPVNTEALEQFDEAQQRYDFLNAQRQDLLDSIRDTEKTISEIDVEARKRFTEAFEPSTRTSARCSRRCSAAASARCG